MVRTFIDPGALKTRLVLQAVTSVPDGFGGFVDNWSDVATIFSLLEPISAVGRFGAGQALETYTHRVTLRHRDGVEAGMRFIAGSRAFDVVTVRDPDESGRYLVCQTRETSI